MNQWLWRTKTRLQSDDERSKLLHPCERCALKRRSDLTQAHLIHLRTKEMWTLHIQGRLWILSDQYGCDRHIVCGRNAPEVSQLLSKYLTLNVTLKRSIKKMGLNSQSRQLCFLLIVNWHKSVEKGTNISLWHIETHTHTIGMNSVCAASYIEELRCLWWRWALYLAVLQYPCTLFVWLCVCACVCQGGKFLHY